MTRWLVRLLGLVLLAGLVSVAGWGIHAGSAEVGEVTRIPTYRASFDVDAHGDLKAVETLTVEFPTGFDRHGIFRFFDVRDPSAPYSRRIPHDLHVTQDGHPAQVDLSREQSGRIRVARIGDPNRFVTPGQHVYRISYTIDGVLEPGSDGHRTQLYWNLVPGGWAQPIGLAQLSVTLPAAAQDVQCAVGNGATSGCTPAGAGTTRVTVQALNLPPRTPVTLKAGLDIATPPAGETRPWVARLDPVFGPGVPALVVVVLLGLAGAAVGLRFAALQRERTPGFPLTYAPPDGLGPAQGAYLLRERAGREAFVASLLEAAEKGAATVSRDEGSWTIEHVVGAPWGSLDDVTRELGTHLEIRGGAFTATRKDPASGERIKHAMDAMKRDLRTWARGQGYLTNVGLGPVGGVVAVGLAVVATLLLALLNPLGMSLTAIVPGLFAVFGGELMFPGAGTRRTATGRELWSRLGGFHRVLSTPSSVARFDFSGRRELYTAYLPWAVAFGCAEEWAKKYRTETGLEPPVPRYLPGYVGTNPGAFVTSMVHDFDATVRSAVSSYEATQHSSGGGGGFSGGGGGGGGGGGSW